MEASRETPERALGNNGNEGIDETSPMKPLRPPVAGHNADEVAARVVPTALDAVSVDEMYKKLKFKEEDMIKAFPKLPTVAAGTSGLKDQYSVTTYLNSLSDLVHKHLNKPGNPLEVIRFFDRNTKAPKDHPTGTACRPDIIALKDSASGGSLSLVYWSALEATGEFLSGNNKGVSHAKSAAYTSYLLQARPDKLEVHGIYVDPTLFKLTVSNACGVFQTVDLKWKPRASRLLLCAWIWRLYVPVVDPCITVNIEGNKAPTFNIKLPNDENYLEYTIQSAGTPFGRRTIIFACPGSGVVIKEQYIEHARRRFKEGEILTKIHKNGTFPGVVRPSLQDQTEEPLFVEGKEGRRDKTRLILLDKAPSIMDAKTVREFLVAMYDLLEITRFLHKKKHILHRDISSNNVLLRSVVPPAESPGQSSANNGQLITKELQDMCFASYLLREKFNPSNHPTKLDTGVLLVDFDMSLDQEVASKSELRAQTGTPTFVARTVVSCKQKRGRYDLVPMPQFDEAIEALNAYSTAVPNRLVTFPLTKHCTYWLPKAIPHEQFKHELQYDAESVFWLILWWAIHACPAQSSPDDNPIDDRHWLYLTTQQDEDEDPRDRFVKEPLEKVVHPDYQPLEKLLNDMAEQLLGDHEKGQAHLNAQDQEESRKQPDYLHEAFQRLIIMFLFANYDEPFMTMQKGPILRKSKGMTQMAPIWSSLQVKNARSSRGKGKASGESSSLQGKSSYNLRRASVTVSSVPSGIGKRGRGEDASGSDLNDGDLEDEEWDPRKRPRRDHDV